MRIYKTWVLIFFLTCVLIFASVCVNTETNAQTLTIDAGKVIKTFSSNPIGINLDYLMDDDAFLKPETPLYKSLKSMKVGSVRYPGGEKSDNYLWSIAPFESAHPHFSLPGNCNWINQDKRFTDDKIRLKDIVLDFDELMALTKSSGTTPLIVVAEDSYYEVGCAAHPTRDNLISNATEWIRYANIKNKFGVKYWMVGNESWNYSNNGQPYLSATQYAKDFIEFAKAMKAVDPSIKVIANSKEKEWTDTLLIVAKKYVDAIAISNYPVWNWEKGYNTYRIENPNFVDNINHVVSSVKKYAPGLNIPVIVSEFNAIDWSGKWECVNDLGHALVIFQMLGDQINIQEVEKVYYWNTRWLANKEKPHDITDAVDAAGNLNATGKAIALWGNYLLDNLVFSSNEGYIRTFASTDKLNHKLNIFLINKDFGAKDVKLNISNFGVILNRDLVIKHAKLSGKGINDTYPLITYPLNTVFKEDSELKFSLDPLSVNVISLSIPDTSTMR